VSNILDENLDLQPSGTSGSAFLSVALIGPNEELRNRIAKSLSECHKGEVRVFPAYPPNLDDVPKLLEMGYEVIILDLDSDQDYAIDLVEKICAQGSANVMVYSAKPDPNILVRMMHAGAIEFLTPPFSSNVVAQALVRASLRRPATNKEQKKNGQLFVFLGAKGGAGVTTIACNFAVAMAKESEHSTVLIDLDLPLGDAALNLGLVPEYSLVDALQNIGRLDGSFLGKLLVKHDSGVSVLAAPGNFSKFSASIDAIAHLITIARQEFDNVVVDVGSKQDLSGSNLFNDATTVYLITQAGVSELRNSNRVISQFFSGGVPKLEVVVNRFEPRALGINENDIEQALTKPIQWKIPDNYSVVRKMQNTGEPLVLENSSISKQIIMMARAACGLSPATSAKSSMFNFKNLGRSFSSKISSGHDRPVTLNLGEETASSEVADEPVRDSAPEKVTVEEVDAHEVVTVVAETDPDLEEVATDAVLQMAEQETAAVESTPVVIVEAETRTYMGETYVKEADGQWHRQHVQNEEAISEAVAPSNDSEREMEVSSSVASVEPVVSQTQADTDIEELQGYRFLNTPAESPTPVFPVYQSTEPEPGIEPEHAWRHSRNDVEIEPVAVVDVATSVPMAIADSSASTPEEADTGEVVHECPLDHMEIPVVPLLVLDERDQETEVLQPKLLVPEIPESVTRSAGLKRRIRIKGRVQRAVVEPIEDLQTVTASDEKLQLAPAPEVGPQLVENDHYEMQSEPDDVVGANTTSELVDDGDAAGQQERLVPAASRGVRRRVRIKGMTRIAATAYAVAAKIQTSAPTPTPTLTSIPARAHEIREEKHPDGVLNHIGSSETRTYSNGETRIYKGAIYARGADGQWYLQ
jgi:pilus assembly protein CpaE